MMMTSASSGFHSLRSNLPCSIPGCISPDTAFPPSAAPLYCNIRCIVCVSRPVVSPSLLAARPVGAARRIVCPSDSRSLMIIFTVVVFPVPGPPVITSSPWFMDSLTAVICCPSNSRSSSRCRLRIVASSEASFVLVMFSRSKSIRAQFNSL